MKNLLFIGGIMNDNLGGEVVKNHFLLSYLEKNYEVIVADTGGIKKGPIQLAGFVLSLLKPVDRIILSASTKTALLLLCALRLIKPRTEVLYFVIGGTLPLRLNKSLSFRAVINHPSKVYVESSYLKKACDSLVKREFQVLPNFKTINHGLRNIENRDLNTLRLVYVSRVSIPKGVVLAAESVVEVIKKTDLNVKLVIYGPIEMDRITFNNLINANASISYGGILDLFSPSSFEAYKILSQFHALILPTLHYGEGFPGVFIDAMSVGLPIITTKHASNESILSDSYTEWIEEPSVDVVAKSIVNCYRRLQANSSKMRLASFRSYSRFETQNVLSDIGL